MLILVLTPPFNFAQFACLLLGAQDPATKALVFFVVSFLPNRLFFPPIFGMWI
jgi:hypothetical protein